MTYDFDSEATQQGRQHHEHKSRMHFLNEELPNTLNEWCSSSSKTWRTAILIHTVSYVALASCWSLRRSLDASREPLCPLLVEASFFSSNLISDLTACPPTNCLSRQFCTAAIITNTHTTTCPERRGLSPFLSSKTADLCFLIIFLLKFQKTIRITSF